MISVAFLQCALVGLLYSPVFYRSLLRDVNQYFFLLLIVTKDLYPSEDIDTKIENHVKFLEQLYKTRCHGDYFFTKISLTLELATGLRAC